MICLISTQLIAGNLPEFKGGHAKYQLASNRFPEDSLFLDYLESPTIDHNGDLRLKLGWSTDNVSISSDYQLIASHGDSIKLASKLPGSVLLSQPVIDDDKRFFDLTHIISQSDNSIYSHRLDRLYIDFTTTNMVTRIGRQAISWGNGLVYTPMDFFNPFDPSAVDKEYKTGDDMLYAQYLRQNGDDLQAVWVVRRDINGEVTGEVDSIAIKYHGFAGDREYDLLLAEHFNDTIFGIGGITDIGGAIWRGDITITHTSDISPGSQHKNIASLVTSLSYSWIGWGHNISGVVEYFYNGFGQGNANYDPVSLAANPQLVERLIRGELFTLGRHYIALSAMVEMTPLWLLTPNVFINASDNSFLAQLVSSYDLKQDWQLLAAISLPTGAPGTEFGGIDSTVAGKQLSTELSLFAQLAWYF